MAKLVHMYLDGFWYSYPLNVTVKVLNMLKHNFGYLLLFLLDILEDYFKVSFMWRMNNEDYLLNSDPIQFTNKKLVAFVNKK